MADEVSQSIVLFGTEQVVPPARPLRAGALEVMLDTGNLRYVRWQGVEVLRAIAFIVRDQNWGTYLPEISDLKVEETAQGFTVSYTAECRDDRQALRYRARI